MSTVAPPRPSGSLASTSLVADAPSDGDRRLGLLLLVAGLVGLGAAFVLAFEKFRLLENPLYIPACSLGEVVNCVSVMRSAQSEAFGFPNPFLGLIGFGGLLATGIALVSGGRFTRPYWLLLHGGLLLAVVFVHWLIFQTLYRIGALCPFCMAVWGVTIPAFWYVTLRTARPLADRPAGVGPVARFALRNHAIIVTGWMLLISALVVERFWI